MYFPTNTLYNHLQKQTDVHTYSVKKFLHILEHLLNKIPIIIQIFNMLSYSFKCVGNFNTLKSEIKSYLVSNSFYSREYEVLIFKIFPYIYFFQFFCIPDIVHTFCKNSKNYNKIIFYYRTLT